MEERDAKKAVEAAKKMVIKNRFAANLSGRVATTQNAHLLVGFPPLFV